jgi:hypothetical protein
MEKDVVHQAIDPGNIVHFISESALPEAMKGALTAAGSERLGSTQI